MNPWIIETEIFIHPFNCIISGPTMGGKTYLWKNIFVKRNSKRALLDLH